MRDFGWFANKFETHHDVYLPAGQCWHMIYTLNLYTKKPQNKTSENKFNVNTTYPRRARWDFQGVLDDTLFLHLEFDMNKYFKNWGSYEVLRKIGGFIIIVVIIYSLALYRILRCAAMILSANFGFAYIDRLIPIIASLFWCIFVCIYTYSTS